MSAPQYRALTVQNGITKQIHSDSQLIVGNGIDCDADPANSSAVLNIGDVTAKSIMLGGAGQNPSVTVYGTGTFTTGSGNVTVNGNTTFVSPTTVTIGAFTVAGLVHNSSSGLLTSSLLINADISPTASIDGSKVVPNFGSQNIVTTGTLSTGAATVSTLAANNTTITGTLSVSSTSTLATVNAGATTVTSLTDSGLTTGVVHAGSGGLFTSSPIVDADVSATAGIAVTKLAHGTDMQILQTEGTTPTWVTVSGDTTIADGGSVTVNKLQGNTLTLGTLGATQDGYVLTWSNSASKLEMLSAVAAGLTVTMGGDVTGLSNNSTVVKIQNNPVTAGGVAEGQFLVGTGSNTWAPTSISGDVSSSGSTAGKLTVTGLQGNPVSSTPATAAQILIENASANGSAWQTLSQDATISATGVVTVASAAGNFHVVGNETVGGTLGVTGATTLAGLTAGATVVSSLRDSGLTVRGIVTNDSAGNISTSVGSDTQILQTESGTPTWVTLSQDATIADGGAVTVVSAAGNFHVGGNLTVSGDSTLSTVTANGAVVMNSTLNVTGATTLGTLNSGATTVTSLVDGGSATVGTTLGVTGVSTLSGGTLTNTLDSITSGHSLVIGGTNATGAIQIGTSASTVTIPGNLNVTGAETITGTSTFNSAAVVNSSLTVSDGYSPPLAVIGNALGGVTLNSDTTSTTPDGSGVALQNDGYTGLEVVKGTNPGTVQVWIPAGSTVQAEPGGQIIATNSTGTEFLQTTYLTNSTALGTALYISADKVCSATDASALASSYCIGFSSGSNQVKTDGRVTPIITGGVGVHGQVMYLDDAHPGQVTATPPTTAGHVVAPIGIMVDTDDLMIRWYTPVVL